MNKLYIYLFEPFNNLRKWFYITVITILFLSSFFFFVGIYSNVVNTENFTVSLRNNETYLSYWQMYIDQPVEDHLNDRPMIYEAMNDFARNNHEEWRRVNKEADQFICDLYNMQNDDFILEYNAAISNGKESFIQADKSFFEHEYLPIFKGRSITEEDFEDIRNSTSPYTLVINVIAGYSYSEKYELGDIIRKPGQDSTLYYDYDGKDLSDYTLHIHDQSYASFRVVGFIEEGITFANSSGSIHKADNEIFVPHIPEISIFFPEKADGEYHSYDTFSWKILIRNGKVEEYTEKINQRLDGLFIDQYYDLMDSYNQAYEILDEVVSTRKDSFLIVAIVLFLFSISGITVSTVNKFKRNIKSYTIHLTVGATNKDIYIFAAVEMLMQILIAFAIIHIPYILSWVELPIIKFINRNIPYMRSPVMYILLLMFAALFVGITVAVTAYCIKKYSLAEAIKGKE